MVSLATPWHILVAIYRLIVISWHACIVFTQVLRSVIQEARQEVADLMALLDDNDSALDAVTSMSLASTENPWQMLIIARTSSFVLLLRLSARRVLHLEVDERFITSKLEVIKTELTLHIQHVSRLLHVPIGMHDTRLVRYTPMKLPYLWREMVVEGSTEAAEPVSCSSAGAEGRSDRKKYVQVLAEGALRRRMEMDRLRLENAPRRASVLKSLGEKALKRKALANATNATTTDTDAPKEETYNETGTLTTPKPVPVERPVRRALSENSHLGRGTEQQRRLGSLRRKRGQFDLYAQGVSSEFSLLAKN